MIQSSFVKYLEKYQDGIVLRAIETLNGSTGPLSYLHRRLLRPDYSVSGKWEALSAENTRVMADVVALDSSLPLKKRDSITRASGDIPKMGLKLKMNENQLTQLDTMLALQRPESMIVGKLFADTPKVLAAIYETNEAIFLEGLSTGLCVLDDSENVGLGIRLDYGYKSANKFTATDEWNVPASATPIKDLRKMKTKAAQDGNTITKYYMDQATFDLMILTAEVKQAFAFSLGIATTSGSIIPTPTLQQVNTTLAANGIAPIEIIDRYVKREKNGTQTTVKPWADNIVVAVCSDTIGSLAWASLAEANHPVAGVTYTTADQFILLSKYRTNDPVTEWTSSQARVVPVIANVDQIYLLDSNTVAS